MNIKYTLLLFGCLFFVESFAQINEIDKLLADIERNNFELIAFKNYIKSAQLENKSNNNLPDPELSGYYMPNGTNNNTTYTEFQISQSMAFPSVYSSRKKWNNLKGKQLDNEYARLRQKLLLSAQKDLIELISLQIKHHHESVRRDQSKKVYEQILELFNKEYIGILDLNKAKIVWLQKQFFVEQLATEIKIMLTALEKINGDKQIDFSLKTFDAPLAIGNLDSIWQAKLTHDPSLQNLKVSEEASLQLIKLEKDKSLPNLTVGYNYQGITGSNYAGLFGGVSIPLWNSKHKVKAAKAHYEYEKSNTISETTKQFSGYQQQYNTYQLLYRKFNEYKAVTSTINDESLLFKAYKLGEFSYLEYYQEQQFYRNTYDKMLEMEKELYQLKAALLKHQL